MKREKLISVRKTLSLTQQAVADRANIKRSYYGLIENGERNPTLPIAIRIAAALGMDVDQAFDHEVFFAGKCYEMKLFGEKSPVQMS